VWAQPAGGGWRASAWLPAQRGAAQRGGGWGLQDGLARRPPRCARTHDDGRVVRDGLRLEHQAGQGRYVVIVYAVFHKLADVGDRGAALHAPAAAGRAPPFAGIPRRLHACSWHDGGAGVPFWGGGGGASHAQAGRHALLAAVCKRDRGRTHQLPPMQQGRGRQPGVPVGAVCDCLCQIHRFCGPLAGALRAYWSDPAAGGTPAMAVMKRAQQGSLPFAGSHRGSQRASDRMSRGWTRSNQGTGTLHEPTLAHNDCAVTAGACPPAADHGLTPPPPAPSALQHFPHPVTALIIWADHYGAGVPCAANGEAAGGCTQRAVRSRFETSGRSDSLDRPGGPALAGCGW